MFQPYFYKVIFVCTVLSFTLTLPDHPNSTIRLVLLFQFNRLKYRVLETAGGLPKVTLLNCMEDVFRTLEHSLLIPEYALLNPSYYFLELNNTVVKWFSVSW